MNIKHKGIGLIEVLITTVVIAIGLLAVASLQGNLIGSSGQSKTRSEAKALCDTRLEQLRDALSKSQFEAIASSSSNDSITGTNEIFTRSWVVETLPDAGSAVAADQTGPDRRRVQVTCTWGDAGAEEQVAVQTVITFEDLGSSSLAAITASNAGLNIASPSTNANSSDEINDATDVTIPDDAVADVNNLFSTGIEGLEDDQYVKDNGVNDNTGSIVYLCSALIPFETGLYTRRVHHKPGNTSFKEAIELFEDNDDNLTCTRRIRYNGGVILAIEGIVYSRATIGNGGNATLLELRNSSNTDLFTFNATESGSFCIFEPATNATTAPYVCYVGGNCVNGPVGTTATTDGSTFTTASVNDNTIVTECPAPIADPVPDPIYGAYVYEEVGPGGWRGKVGLLGIPTSSKNVCFSEELIDITQQESSQHTLDTARNYFTRRTNGSDLSNEGINQPYSCHDMIIIDGQSTTVQVHDTCIDEATHIAGLGLASKNIQRDLSGTTANTVITSTNTTFCANANTIDYTIVGSFSNAANIPTVTISDTDGTNGDCTTTAPTSTTYTCTITTAANSVTIVANDGNGAESCSDTPISTTGCTITFTTPEAGINTVNVTVSPTGTGTLSNISLSGTNAPSCAYPTCTIADDLTDTLVATADCDGTPSTVTGNTTIAAGATSATITMGTCTAPEVATTYTVSGAIAIASQADITELPISIDTGSCTGTFSASNVNYTCTVDEGVAFTITYTASPTCSDNNKKHILSITGGTRLTDVVWTFGSNGISSDQTVNGTVVRSSSGC